MVTVHAARPVTNALLECLSFADLLVGDGVAPAGGGWSGVPGGSTFVGYVVLHPLTGGESDGTIGDANADVAPRYAVNAYGATREQCELIGDRARAAIFGTPPVIPGRRLLEIRIDRFFGAAEPDYDSKPVIFGASDRYELVLTPA